jgi:hypothetical protein
VLAASYAPQSRSVFVILCRRFPFRLLYYPRTFSEET